MNEPTTDPPESDTAEPTHEGHETNADQPADIPWVAQPQTALAHGILRRPVEGRLFAGVCRGLADFSGIHVGIVRVLFAIAAFFGGSGLILYLAGAILVPSEDNQTGLNYTTIEKIKTDRSPATLIGLFVLLVGGLFLLNEAGGSNLILPLLLITVGAVLLLWQSPERISEFATAMRAQPTPANPATGATPPPPPPNAMATSGIAGAPQTPEAPTPPSEPVSYATANPDMSVGPAVGGTVPPPPPVMLPPDPWSPPPAPQPTPRPRRQRRGLSKITWMTLAGLVTFFGIAITLDQTDALNIDADRTIAWGLVGVGAVLVATGFIGRARGLLFWGALLIPAMFIAGADFSTEFVDTTYRITEVSPIEGTDFDTGVGDVAYDFRSLDLTADETIVIEHGVGQLVVRVPPNVALDIDASAGIGEVRVFNQSAEGPGAEISYGEGQGTNQPTLTLLLRINVGELRVTR